MFVMHMERSSPWFSPYGTEPDSEQNSIFRDAALFFAITNVLLLGVALYHGLFGLRTMIFEFKPSLAVQRITTTTLILLGLALFAFGAWGAIASHQLAILKLGR
jgi:succinate dehydrogenase hydrophobic anchor subunit